MSKPTTSTTPLNQDMWHKFAMGEETGQEWIGADTTIIPIRGNLAVTKEDIDNAPKGHWDIKALKETLEKETK